MEQEGPALVKKIKGSFLFKIKGSDGKVEEWLVDLKSAPGSVTKGTGTLALELTRVLSVFSSV